MPTMERWSTRWPRDPMAAGNRATDLPAFCGKRVLILGCGNRLFGDDGFGPEVIDRLEGMYEVPGDVYAMDVGTGIRKLLFTLALDPGPTREIILVDAVDRGGVPGEIYELTADELPAGRRDDFSLHQVPSSNLVHELAGLGISVRVLACQVASVPDSIMPGLSPPMTAAIPGMCRRIAAIAGLAPGS